jgi:hypothetical protein
MDIICLVILVLRYSYAMFARAFEEIGFSGFPPPLNKIYDCKPQQEFQLYRFVCQSTYGNFYLQYVPVCLAILVVAFRFSVRLFRFLKRSYETRQKAGSIAIRIRRPALDESASASNGHAAAAALQEDSEGSTLANEDGGKQRWNWSKCYESCKGACGTACRTVVGYAGRARKFFRKNPEPTNVEMTPTHAFAGEDSRNREQNPLNSGAHEA